MQKLQDLISNLNAHVYIKALHDKKKYSDQQSAPVVAVSKKPRREDNTV